MFAKKSLENRSKNKNVFTTDCEQQYEYMNVL